MPRSPSSIAFILFFVFVQNAGCLAQDSDTKSAVPPANPQARTTQAPTTQGRGAPPREVARERLSRMPVTVPVALPPDARFITGFRNQYATTKSATQIRFSTANKLADVADWYEKTLTATGWNVIPSPNRLMATRGTMVANFDFIENKPYGNEVHPRPSTTVQLNYSGEVR